MKYLRRLLHGIPVDAVLEDLACAPELWNEHTLRTRPEYAAHTAVSDIWVRYRSREEYLHLKDQMENSGWTDTHRMLRVGQFVGEEHDSEWYPGSDKLPHLKELIFALVQHYQVERLGGVLITRVPAGGEVKPHIDHGWHARYYEKLAVQLQSAPEQAFCYADGQFKCPAGTVYTFDNSQEHWVTNESQTDRMTAIICVRRDQRKPRLVEMS